MSLPRRGCLDVYALLSYCVILPSKQGESLPCDHHRGRSKSMKGRERCRRIIVTAVGAAWLTTGLIGPSLGIEFAEPLVYVFTRVATVPGPGPGTELFDLDFEPHSINAAGNVAFAADLATAGGTDIGEGVFASR